ncbi:MAG: lysoplasmalogenase [Eubacteriales bacterium]|nr:lysoplasmalogenase [Eubacteriales bacterium]
MTPLIIAAIVSGCAAEAVFIVFEYRKNWLPALLLKSAASVLFLLVGFLAMRLSADASYARLIFIGLALGAVGDVCLNLRNLCGGRARLVFMLGIAAFLLGHLCYIWALAVRAPGALLYAAIACVPVSFAVIRFVLRRVNVDGALKIFGVIYLVIVLLMACLAVTLLVFDPGSGAYRLFALGGLLFAASDVLLVLNQFGKRAYPAFRALNLSLYYLGQIGIALTIALMR